MHQLALLICLSAFIGFSVIAQSCGRSLVKLSLEDRERMYRSLYSATPENASTWVHLWDNESWIVSLGTAQVEKPIASHLRHLIARGMTDHFSTSLLPAEANRFQDILQQNLTLEFTHSPNPPNVTHLEPEDAAEWYAKITLPVTNTLWENILGEAIPIFPLDQKTKMNLAIQQFRALESVSEFAWVEPNLGHTPQQATPGCAEEDPNSPEFQNAARPPEWFQAGNRPILPCENRIRQVYTRINYHKAQDYFSALSQANPNTQKYPVVVAIIDTGIDHEHEDLKGRVFANPGEVNGQEGVDDDQNGFVDDIYGINATFREGRIDGSFSAPGSADVGGPGSPCPAKNLLRQSGGSCGHGTHVAGIVSAQAGGPFAFGLCDQCRVYSLRVSKSCVYPETSVQGRCIEPAQDGTPPPEGSYIANGKIYDWDQVTGLNYLLKFPSRSVQEELYTFVVNMSLGKYIYSRTMASALRRLEAQEVLIVAAAGNDNTETPMFPAAYRSTLAVCATSEDAGTQYTLEDGSTPSSRGTRGQYAKAAFSNFGEWIDLCAPGTEILSTYPGNLTEVQSGTSQASPLVSAAAGYIRSIFPNESLQTIRTRLERFANPNFIYSLKFAPLNKHYFDEIYGVQSYLLGTGMLDVEASLKADDGGAEISFAEIQRTSGSTSQLSGGCVVSTIAARRPFFSSHTFTSMPFLMAQALSLLWFFRRRPQKKSKALS